MWISETNVITARENNVNMAQEFMNRNQNAQIWMVETNISSYHNL